MQRAREAQFRATTAAVTLHRPFTNGGASPCYKD